VEKPDRPAVSSRPQGEHWFRIELTHPRILHRWIEAESGAYHDEGESTEETHDVQDVVSDWLLEAVENDVIVPLATYVAGRDDTDYGWVRQRDVWGRIYDSEAFDWRTFVIDSRQPQSRVAATLLEHLSSRTRDLLKTVEQVARVAGLFKRAGPDLWRCRERRGTEEFRSARELGSPPPEFAGENRMTAQGDSAFYGSTSLSCAAMEVIQARGDSYELCAGKFSPSRPLYYLDVFDLPTEPSPFASDSRTERDALSFLRHFASSVSEPNDGELRHYVPTQVFVAFLRASVDELQPDAIRFASSLDTSSENWVVFVDHEHCLDANTVTDALYMLLDHGSVTCSVAAEMM